LLKNWPASSRRFKITIILLLLYLLASVLSYFPHYLSYFNELVLDRKNAYRILADSNIDWGQNRWYLREFQAQHPDYIFEPSPEAVFDRVLYGFTEVQVLQALIESIASEHSARMVAMRNATDAALDLIDSLTLTYNKARQEGITNELMDIIGGTVALE
jgi:ATP synthase F1 gamma subunit